MKRLKIFQITIVVLFIIFIFFFLRPVNYVKEYEVDEIKINESYNKEDNYYYFNLTYNDITLDYLFESSYKQKRTFIEEVKIVEDEENFCLIPRGNTIEFIPLCYDDEKIIYYQNINDKLKEQIPEEYLESKEELNESYQDIKIYNRDYTYLLWNYNGFYYINENTEKEIPLFAKEIYNISLVAYTKDYLIIADYDKEYTFNKFYRISLKNGNVKEYEVNRKIYFDSYYPGYEKNKLYIVDNKEEVMYEFNAQNGKLDKINAKMLNNEEWEKVGIKTLVNQDKKFTYPSNYEYRLKDSTLYLNYKDKDITMFIDNNITDIIRIKDNLVFYLKTDTVYVFDPTKGISKLLNNFEWNFNYKNMIYID